MRSFKNEEWAGTKTTAKKISYFYVPYHGKARDGTFGYIPYHTKKTAEKDGENPRSPQPSTNQPKGNA